LKTPGEIRVLVTVQKTRATGESAKKLREVVRPDFRKKEERGTVKVGQPGPKSSQKGRLKKERASFHALGVTAQWLLKKRSRRRVPVKSTTNPGEQQTHENEKKRARNNRKRVWVRRTQVLCELAQNESTRPETRMKIGERGNRSVALRGEKGQKFNCRWKENCQFRAQWKGKH